MNKEFYFVANADSPYAPAFIEKITTEKKQIICSRLEEQTHEVLIKWRQQHPNDCLTAYIHFPAIVSEQGSDWGVLNSGDNRMETAYEKIYKEPLLCARYAAECMEAPEKKGAVMTGNDRSITFITDICGLRAQKSDTIYGSLYAALHRSCQSLALQLAPSQIRVNCMAPGGFPPQFAQAIRSSAKMEQKLPLGRRGAYEELADTILFLASRKASYITGETICCDGGLRLAGMPEKEEFYGWDPGFIG